MLVLCFASFLGFGLALILVGANQAELSSHFALDFEQSGQLGSSLALGIGAGVVCAGPLFDRYATRPLFVGALVLAAAALLSVGDGVSFTRLVLHLFVVGMGIGGYNTLINATVAERFDEKSAKPMSVIHSGASVGAMIGPALIGWLWADDWTASFHFTGVGHAALAVCAAFVRFPERVHVQTGDSRSDDSQQNDSRSNTSQSGDSQSGASQSGATQSSDARGNESIDRSGENRVLSGAMIPFAGIAFSYVGIETSLIVFAIPYSAEFGLSAAIGRTAISVFWMGLLVGRLSVLARRSLPDAGVLLTAGALGSVLLALGVGSGFERVDALFGVLGLALGSVYPVNMALTGQRFSRARGAATGVAAGAGSLGGFAVPWWTGAVADTAGIAAALFCLIVLTLMIAVLSAAVRRTS